MRHQYLLVKQKIKKSELPVGSALVGGCGGGGGGGGEGEGEEEFDWEDGVSYWSNFLRYKEVFGDVPLVYNHNHDHDHDGSLMGAMNNDENGGSGGFSGSSRGIDMVDFGHLGHSMEGGFGAEIDGGEDGVLGLGLGFEYDAEEGEENFHDGETNHMREDGDEGFVYEEVEANGSEVRKRKRVEKGFEKKAWSFLANQLSHLKEMEKRFEQREIERENERHKRERLFLEREKEREKTWEERVKERAKRENIMEERRKQRLLELEAMEKEHEERERRRREKSSIREREWEERMNIRRSEWKKRVDNMLNQHRAEMGQIQSRILHEQQNLTNQLLSVVSQWSGHPNGLSDHTAASSHYLSQIMASLNHVNGIVHDDTRVEGDNQEDQFIVD
ncbi:uncharacterized protein LOC141657345 [Silene latifolia]|uniref:uncharacterized protein LOC141657345 n=1 Tax=Silene latifolia TaxID=37657 RepID=UPI003D76ADB9